MPIVASSQHRRAAGATAIACALVLLGPSAAMRHPAIDRLPSLMLWAWERPEDLRSLPPDTGVAFLAQTIVVESPRVHVLLRRQPLKVSPATPLVAVTRIESRAHGPVTDATVTRIVDAIAATAGLPGVVGVQIDFDAVQSERASYRRILTEVRRALDARVALSMTALASWCMDDRWLEDLPVDEIVPMLFRMGPTQPHRDSTARALRAPACLGAVGISLDEPLSRRPAVARLYVFSPIPWTEALTAAARERAVP